MLCPWIAVASSLTFIFNCASCQNISNLTFPNSFFFGAASSAYQIEGAWNESGKGPNIWDFLVHNVPIVVDGTTGDVTCDSYHRYKDDIAALKQLGVNHYRFSIAWSRLLPRGFANEINPEGVQYYNNLINGLLVEGIEPWVTIYHMDMPEPIYYLGNWNNDKIIEYLTDYADLLFRLFGNRVKTWFTINEPMMCCAVFIKNIILILGKSGVPTGVTEYLCGHNVLRVHAKIYRLYQQKYKKTQKGRITIVLNIHFPIPASNSDADIAAAQRKRDFDLGWYLHPLVYGDYPQTMIDKIGNKSLAQGFNRHSRLPKFTHSEKSEIRGAYDFVAINYYTSELVAAGDDPETTEISFQNDCDVRTYQDPTWEGSAASWLKVYPRGFREMLVYIKENYGNPEIVVTEQGYADEPNTLNDTARINYYQLHLSEALKAIHEDGVRLTAYTAWSLLDSFEWKSGFSVKFGLYHVDFEDENKTRTPKESAYYYKKVIATRCLTDNCV